MKLILILFMAATLAVSGQNSSVLLWRYATNDPNWQYSPPTNAPYGANLIGTNTAVIPPQVLMSSNTLYVCQQTNAAAMAVFLGKVSNAQSNANYIATQAVLADIQVLVNRFATNNLDRASMVTNTLSNAQLNVVVLNILKTLHKLELLLPALYTQNNGFQTPGN